MHRYSTIAGFHTKLLDMPGNQQSEAAVQCSNLVFENGESRYPHTWLQTQQRPACGRNIHMQAMASALHINEQGLLKLKCTADCQAMPCGVLHNCFQIAKY